VNSKLLQKIKHAKKHQKVLARMWSNWNPCTSLVGIYNGSGTVQNRMEVLLNIKNVTTMHSNSPVSVYIPRELKVGY
jgi:hypothetical protein